MRHLVGARAQLKGVSVDLSNQIRSILKTFGLMPGKGAGHRFAIRVRDLLEGRPSLSAIIDPLLAAWQAVRAQIAVLDRRLIGLAKGDPTWGSPRRAINRARPTERVGFRGEAIG